MPSQVDGWVKSPAPDGEVPLTIVGSALEIYGSLDPVEGMAVGWAATVLLGVLVVGLAPGYGMDSIETATKSPVISAIAGVPTALTLATFLYAGDVLAGSSVGILFAIPLVVVGVGLLPATAIGFVAIGGLVARRFGTEKLSVRLLVGAGACALAPLGFPYGFAVVALASALGSGACLRELLGSRTKSRDERVVPPAHDV